MVGHTHARRRLFLRRFSSLVVLASNVDLLATAAFAYPAKAQNGCDISAYGARGDGIADDNAAFELCCVAAAKQGAYVWLHPNKTYVVGKATGFAFPPSVKGIISNGATLRINPSIQYAGKVFSIPGDNCNLSNLIVDCQGERLTNNANGQGAIIFYVQGKNVRLTRSQFRGRAGSFILGAAGCDNLDASHVRIATTGASLRGIYVGDKLGIDTRGVNLSDITITGDMPHSRSHIIGHSLALYRCHSSIVNRCTIYGGGEGGCFGISFFYCKDCRAIGNQAFDTSFEMINATSSADIKISGNHGVWSLPISNVGYGKDFGISIEGCVHCKINGNILNGSYKAGIACAATSADSHDNIVSNNQFIDCAVNNADVRSGLLVYAAKTFSNINSIYSNNRIINSKDKRTDYTYFETSFGTGHVGSNRLIYARGASQQMKYKVDASTKVLIDHKAVKAM